VSLSEYLIDLVHRSGSDLVLKQDRPPLMRLNGQLIASEYPVQTRELLWENLKPILTKKRVQALEEDREVDLSFEMDGVARFRVNVFHQRGRVGSVIRAIPLETPTIDSLSLPPVLKDIASHPNGIILVTGPTGSGKSTTLAAIVEHINASRHAHIITIEDPIEFVYTDKKSTVTQRGIGDDTLNAGRALRSALRQNPDVILAGEMRDRETMELALHAAETGHLVMSTLHTNDAKQSVQRLCDAFPPEVQEGLLRMLSICMRAVVCQRLIRKADGSGRVAAHEIMIVSPTIRTLIEKGKIDDMAKAIEASSGFYRMQSFNQSLTELVRRRQITTEAALETSSSPGDLKLMLKGMSRGGTTSMSRRDVELRKEEGGPPAPEPGASPSPPPAPRGGQGGAPAGARPRPRRGPLRRSTRLPTKGGTGGGGRPAPPDKKMKIDRGFDFA
jgi:twitching motility protein PilT